MQHSNWHPTQTTATFTWLQRTLMHTHKHATYTQRLHQCTIAQIQHSQKYNIRINAQHTQMQPPRKSNIHINAQPNNCNIHVIATRIDAHTQTWNIHAAVTLMHNFTNSTFTQIKHSHQCTNTQMQPHANATFMLIPNNTTATVI